MSSRPDSKVENKPKSASKKKGGKKKKEAEPFISKYREIDYEELMEVPDILLRIKLTNPKTDNNTFEITVPINYSLAKVRDLINIKHNSSCKNIKLFMDIERER